MQVIELNKLIYTKSTCNFDDCDIVILYRLNGVLIAIKKKTYRYWLVTIYKRKHKLCIVVNNIFAN